MAKSKQNESVERAIKQLREVASKNKGAKVVPTVEVIHGRWDEVVDNICDSMVKNLDLKAIVCVAIKDSDSTSLFIGSKETKPNNVSMAIMHMERLKNKLIEKHMDSTGDGVYGVKKKEKDTTTYIG